MHQRSGATTYNTQYTRLTSHNDDVGGGDNYDRHGASTAAAGDATLNIMENAGAPNRGGAGVTKKLLLWLVVVLQICFIGCFWLLQLGFSASVGGVAGGGSTTNALSGAAAGGRGLPIIDSNNGRVNFIRKAGAALRLQTQAPSEGLKVKPPTSEENVSNFAKDFYMKPNRLNRTEGAVGDGEDEMAPPPPREENPQIWCFRAGTRNESATRSQAEADAEADMLMWEPEERCSCEADWHGRDCGQPEVMWRALMMSRRRQPFELQRPQHDRAHRLVHMLAGNFPSLDMLELQIKAVAEVVDYFIVYLHNVAVKLRELKALERKLRELLSRGNYLVYHCGLQKSADETTAAKPHCTAAHAYREFRRAAGRVYKPSDLFLYTSDREILAPHALTFLKYYAVDVRLMRFRMKYNVYGFYWQHPLRTYLSGVISSLVHLDNPRLGNADPAQLLRESTSSTSSAAALSSALIIGDLNHVGGWYCKYCLQPDEIIDELLAQSSMAAGVADGSKSHAQPLHDVQFPNATRTHHIDAAYLRSLIATGVYVDGRTALTKLRRYSDRYYAPVYAEANSWKFGNLLVNLYESLEEDVEDVEAAVY